MKRAMKSGLVPLALLITLLGACRDPSDWYPCGMVELAGSYELESDGTKSLYATVRISNTGGSVISHSTFGLSASTDFSCYYNTVVSEVRILPGMAIWTTLAIPYANPEEYLLQDGLLVENGFFE
ncbi:MAG: hypothetical protein ABIJ86_02815 [Spirochaetota bacterium]